MKFFLKIAISLIFITLGSATFAQRGLNVQNRINSKVQTRVKGKVNNVQFSDGSSKKKPATLSPEQSNIKPEVKPVTERSKGKKIH